MTPSSLNLSPGVAVSFGQVTHKGPDRKEDPVRLSKRAYERLHQVSPVTTNPSLSPVSAVTMSGVPSSEVQQQLSMFSDDSMAELPSITPLSNHNHHHQEHQRNQTPVSSSSGAPMRPGSQQPWLSDVDATAGGRLSIPPPNLAPSASTAALEAPLSPDDELMQSPMWGPAMGKGTVALPVLPEKPGTRQRKLATGLLDTRNPRDRVHPSVKKNTADAARLPPPPVGQTTGHGFVQKPPRKPTHLQQSTPSTVPGGLDSPHSISSAATSGVITQVSPAVVRQLLN